MSTLRDILTQWSDESMSLQQTCTTILPEDTLLLQCRAKRLAQYLLLIWEQCLFDEMDELYSLDFIGNDNASIFYHHDLRQRMHSLLSSTKDRRFSLRDGAALAGNMLTFQCSHQWRRQQDDCFCLVDLLMVHQIADNKIDRLWIIPV